MTRGRARNREALPHAPPDGIRARDEALLEKLKEAKAPVVAAINKADAASPEALAAAAAKLQAFDFIRAINGGNSKNSTN